MTINNLSHKDSNTNNFKNTEITFEGNRKNKTFQNKYKGRMYQHRKSYEREINCRKPLLPMLLKFKDNGKTVNLVSSPQKGKNSVKKTREESLERRFNGTIHNPLKFENDKISEVVRESLTYFHPKTVNGSSKV